MRRHQLRHNAGLPSLPDCLSAAPVIALLMVMAFCLPYLFVTLVGELIAFLSTR